MPELEAPLEANPEAVTDPWCIEHRAMLDEFCRSVGADRKKLRDELRKIAMAYGVNRLHAQDRNRGREQKRAIGQLVTSMLRTLELLPKIDSDYAAAIDDHAAHGVGAAPVTLATLHAQTERMIESTQTFLARYKPSGVKSNFALERAVAALLALIEGNLGQPVTFSENTAKQIAPQPLSNGGRSMVLFLQAIDPSATPTSICNMVERVRILPNFTPTPFEEIMGVSIPPPLGGPASEADEDKILSP